MFTIAAPYPLLQTTSILPNPLLGDQEGGTSSVNQIRAIDGTVRTYVKTTGGLRQLQWEFRLYREKGLELRAFLLAYFASKVQITDHNGRVWVGNFTGDPFQFNGTSRAGGCGIGEHQQITLMFEGTEQ